MSAKTNPSNTSQCECPERKNHQSILYTLLSSGTSSTTMSSSTTMTDDSEMKEETGEMAGPNPEAIFPWDCSTSLSRSPSHASVTHNLPIVVKLKYAEEVCPYVAQLLLKTVDFIRGLPSVLCLSRPDRARLLRHCWSELLILTMAQYRFRVQVEKVLLCRDSGSSTEDACVQTQSGSVSINSISRPISTASDTTPIAKSCAEKDCRERESALLKYIIATQGVPTTSDIDTLNTFFQKCQTLDIDDKEFAYLKTTIFFNPDVSGLSSTGLVETLQGHAQLKLSEYVTALHPRDPLRFAHLLLSLPPLRNIRPRVVTQLFFRQLIGDALEMEDIIQQMLVSE